MDFSLLALCNALPPMHSTLITPRPPYLLLHLILIRLFKGSSTMPCGGMPANWNRKIRQPVALCYTYCWRSVPMEIRETFPNAVYAIGLFPERTVQLHISDTSTWTIVPFGVEVLVGQRDGPKLSLMPLLDVPDVSCSRQRFHSQENLTPHLKPKMMSCPRWFVLAIQYVGATSETRLRSIVHTSVFVKI